MGGVISKMNNKCSFDFDAYIREREELAEDLRRISKDAVSHRQVKGSWQVIQGASGVAAGIAGGVALVAAPFSLPIVATAAMIVGNSITAASLASSAATYSYGHVADKDIAKRLQNLRHVIESISRKDEEINSFVKVPRSSASAKPIKSPCKNEELKEGNANESEPLLNDPNPKRVKLKEKSSESIKRVSLKQSTAKNGHDESIETVVAEKSVKNSPSINRPTESIKKTTLKDSKNPKETENNTVALKGNNKKAAVSPEPVKKKRKPSAIQACQNLCEVWEEWDLATKENKSVGFDLAIALVKSQGIFMGTHSMIQGSKQVREEQDLETALAATADMIDRESLLIRQLDLRYLSCIPTERRLSRGRLMYLDGGGGQITMVVTFHRGYTTPIETLKSDSTNSIRLPEGATNITVKFIDRAGNIVKRVNRPAPKQPWVKSEDGKEHEVEECKFDNGDGVDAVFVVKGCVAHAYIHKAWDFGRIKEPRSWEWWDNVDEESKELLPDIEARSRLARSRAAHMDSPCGLELCGTYDVSDELAAPVA